MKERIYLIFNLRGQFHQRSMGSFYAHRSLKHQKTDNMTVFFVLLGCVSVKTAHRVLMKLTPGRQ